MTSENLPLSPHQPSVVRCGTLEGARAHRKAHEKLCDLCLAANAEYLRDYRVRRAVRANPQQEREKAIERLAKAKEHLKRVEAIIREYNSESEPAIQPVGLDELSLPTFLTSP